MKEQYTKKVKKIKLSIIPLFAALLVSCQLLPENTQLRSFRVLVQQGNIIEENKVDLLRINMTKEQVVFLLGEPVLNNIFNKNRWDYVYFRKRDPEETKLNMVSIFFDKDIVVSMKRITKNNEGLFEISNKSKDLPEFTSESEIASIESSIFDDIELKGTTKKEINIEEEVQKTNEDISKNKIKKNNKNIKNVKQNDTQIKKYNEEVISSVGNYEIDLRKNDYEVVESLIYEWKNSWEKKDINQYFSFYIKEYTSEYFNNHDLWKEDRFNRINNKSNINIEITDLEIEFNFNENEIAYATFKQKYRSDEYTDIIFKKITWIKTNADWKISSEIVINNLY